MATVGVRGLMQGASRRACSSCRCVDIPYSAWLHPYLPLPPSPSLVTPYQCRLGDLLCFCMSVCLLYFCVICVLCVFLHWYCWLGLLTCKNRLPNNLYCVGGDVKPCSINQSRLSLSVLIWQPADDSCRLASVRFAFEWCELLRVTVGTASGVASGGEGQEYECLPLGVQHWK